jgi:hypothetical protein
MIGCVISCQLSCSSSLIEARKIGSGQVQPEWKYVVSKAHTLDYELSDKERKEDGE